MKHVVSLILSAFTALGITAAASAAPRQKPAVLFHGGVHNRYIVRPLVEMGFAVDVGGNLAEKLASGKYNVVVVHRVSADDRKALEDFMQKGGGVFQTYPSGSHARTADWTANMKWIAAQGARPRWEAIVENDKKNQVRDVMRVHHSWTNDVAPPFNKGVDGLLVFTWRGSTGAHPPMSFDFSKDWKVIVRGPESMSSRPSKRSDTYLQEWIPKEGVKQSPPIMGVREMGKGRLAVLGIGRQWTFAPPSFCPTVENLLAKGVDDKPSKWLRLFANTFRWLAEPSMAAGMGGLKTPDTVLNPPKKKWGHPAQRDWSKLRPIANQPQNAGLIGARTELSSGTGTVADYVREAKKAGLKFIVFMEDSLKLDRAKWDKLVAECKANTDENFLAAPGLTYEDAQGNHLYLFADKVTLAKDDMLLPDRRLATTQKIRTKAYFRYQNELTSQKVLSGFWNHKNNQLHHASYKLYNSFPIVSFEDGKQIDDALDEYLYLVGIGGLQAACAFEFMSSPKQVAKRAGEGWRVVAHRPVTELDGKWHKGAYSFSGSGSQYITNGPRILAWQAANNCMHPNGLWWRPDLWEVRLRLRVASDVGLKSVAVHDGHRGAIRRWLPDGAKSFEQDLVLAHSQQRTYTLIVEDVNGKKAISMGWYPRNLIMEEFFCSDRCNPLGNCRLRTRDDQQHWIQVSFRGNMGITPSKGLLMLRHQPAVCLTRKSPTLPIDGKPMGFPTATLDCVPRIPGENKYLFSYPNTYLISPEIAIGQADLIYAFDPKEQKVEKSELGHKYEQPQLGWGNSWGGWQRLVPTKKVKGYVRTYACNWVPGTVRMGWHETVLTAKEDIETKDGIRVMSTGSRGWRLYVGGKTIVTEKGMTPVSGVFKKGSYATLSQLGGSVIFLALDDNLEYRVNKSGGISLYAGVGRDIRTGETLAARVAFAGAGGGTPHHVMDAFARAMGVVSVGDTAYEPEILRGKQIDNFFIWRLDGQQSGIEAKIPKVDLNTFLTTSVENLNDKWSVVLLDKTRKTANTRALPIRDGRAFAQLDPYNDDLHVFIGHPVIADRNDVRIEAAWKLPGVWHVEAHNPTDKPMQVSLKTAPGWDVFDFSETIKLAPGSSKHWDAKTVEDKK